ncbi:trigger factor [Clostridiales bacterium KA00134]|nr:trigger factor [Clostridiales bacterium KA00134]
MLIMEVEMVKLINKEGNSVSFELVIPADEIRNAQNQVYLKNKKSFVIPGFRKGHVPQKMIENLYGKDVFTEDAINEILPGLYDAAIKELNLKPIAMPDVDFKEKSENGDLPCEFKVEVEPEVEVKDYLGLEVEDVKFEVTDELLDSLVENERRKNARIINVDDRAAKLGDRVNIDFEGFVDGKAFEGGKGENQDLELGSKTFIEGFEDQIVGKNPGDEFEIEVTFPEQYHQKDLAGKPATFKIKLNSISFEELPELDDEFIKDISDFDTLEEYKKDLKSKKEEEFAQRAEVERENKVVEKLIEQVSDDIPEAMINTVLESEIENYNRSLQMQGMTFDNYLKMLGSSLEDFKKERRPQAVSTVKARLAIEAVRRQEKIEVSEDEVKAEAEEMAKKYADGDEKRQKDFVDMILKGDVEGLKKDIAFKKAVKLLVENAKFIEAKEEKKAKKTKKVKKEKEEKVKEEKED